VGRRQKAVPFLVNKIMKIQIENLSMQEQFELAKKKTAEITARGRKTEKELKDKLRQYGFCPDVCDAAAQWACEYYFIDDAEYARVYVQTASKKYGRRRIEQALRFKGVASEYIEDAFAEFDFEDVREKLEVEVEKRLGGNFERKNVDKVVRHFLARGYAYEQIRSALDMAKQNHIPEEDNDGF